MHSRGGSFAAFGFAAGQDLPSVPVTRFGARLDRPAAAVAACYDRYNQPGPR
jgi:hypothetical protein